MLDSWCAIRCTRPARSGSIDRIAVGGGLEDRDGRTGVQVAGHRLGNAELNGDREHAGRDREPAGALHAGHQHRAQQQLPGLNVRVRHQAADIGGDGGERCRLQAPKPTAAARCSGSLLDLGVSRGGAHRDKALRATSDADRLLPRERARVGVVDVGEHPARCRGRQAAPPARWLVRDVSLVPFSGFSTGLWPGEPDRRRRPG